MKTENIEIPVIQHMPQFLFKTFAAPVIEIRQKITRQREVVRGKARLAALNDHLLRDIGLESGADRSREIDRNWML